MQRRGCPFLFYWAVRRVPSPCATSSIACASGTALSSTPADAAEAKHRARRFRAPFPTARPTPQLVVGFTDARVYRNMGAIAYGAGLMSPEIDPGEFGRRFHGHDERIAVESLRLTTPLWLDVTRDLLV